MLDTVRNRRDAMTVVDRSMTGVLLLVTGVLVVTPVLWTFRRSFEDDFAGIRAVLNNGDFVGVLWTTTYLAVGSLVISLVLGTMMAWWAHRLPLGRRWLGVLPMAPMIVPGVALTAGWAFLLSPRIGYVNTMLRALPILGGREGPFDVYTVTWIIILTGFTGSAFVYVFVRSALSEIHQDLLDAGAISGARSWRVLVSIVIPLIRTALVYAGATVFLLSVGQVTKPLLLGRQAQVDVLGTEMYSFVAEDPTNYAAAATYGLPIVGIGVVLIVGQRFFLGDQRKYVTAGGKSARPMATTSTAGQLGLLASFVIMSLLPLLAIVYVSLSTFWTSDISLQGLSLDAYRDVLGDPLLFSAVKNTFYYALVTVIITLPLSMVVARVIYNRRKRPYIAGFQEVVVSLPLGIPGIIFGLGLILTYVNAPFDRFDLYGRDASMIILYTTLMIPFATRIQLSALANIGEDLGNAASVNGAGWIRRLLSVDLAMIRPALASSGALMIAMLAHEFSASLIVRSTNTQVMSTELYTLWRDGDYPEVAVMSCFMCILTGAGVMAAFALGGRSAAEGVGAHG